MAAGLAALGDHDIGPAGQRGAGMGEGLDLADQLGAGRLDGAREGGGIAEREHHRRRRAIQHTRQQLGLAGQGPGDEAAADPRVAGSGEFPIEPGGIAVAAADQAEAAAGRDRRCQPPAGGAAHRGQQDRQPDIQRLGQSCPPFHRTRSLIVPGPA